MLTSFGFSENLTGEIELINKMDVTLSKGYTYSKVFLLQGQKFLFSHNAKTGQTDIWNLNRGGAAKYSAKWSTGWTNIDFYNYNGDVYLFHEKGGEGTARISKLSYTKIMSNEGIGTKVYEDKWSKGWTTTKFFVHNNIIYLLHYKKDTGLCRLNASTKGGDIGKKIYEKTWSKGYTNFAMTTNGINFYILYQKGGEGTCVINAVNLKKLEVVARVGYKSENLGTESYRKKWSTGWSNICFFNLDNEVYMFLNKSKGGTARIEKLNYNGTPGTRVYDKKWTDGWSEIEIYYQNGKPYLFHQKASTGQVKISQLSLKK